VVSFVARCVIAATLVLCRPIKLFLLWFLLATGQVWVEGDGVVKGRSGMGFGFTDHGPSTSLVPPSGFTRSLNA